MVITDEMAAAAYNRFVNAINETEPCDRCEGRGYAHQHGENGRDPDWCDKCGGDGFATKYDEQTCMKLALKAALDCAMTEVECSGFDANGIRRVSGTGSTRDIAKTRGGHAASDYIRGRPSTGPLSAWTFTFDRRAT